MRQPVPPPGWNIGIKYGILDYYHEEQNQDQLTDERYREYMNILGAVMAGGKSRRMGVNKNLLPYGSGTLLSHSISLLRAVTPDVIIVGDPGDSRSHSDIPMLPDIKPGFGPIGGVYTALMESSAERVLVIASDMPFLEQNFLEYLISFQDEYQVIVPRTSKGFEPLCSVWSKDTLQILEDNLLQGQLRLAKIFPHLSVFEITFWNSSRFNDWETMFFNINSPDDYTKALGIGSDHE